MKLKHFLQISLFELGILIIFTQNRKKSGSLGSKKVATKKTKPSPPPPKDQITLGKITFRVGPDLPKAKVLTNLQVAYFSLVAETRKKLMQYPINLDLTIQKGYKSHGIVQRLYQGGIEWDAKSMSPQAKGEYDYRNTRFFLKTPSISILSHELCHLYLQRIRTWSQAFTEGHCKALQRTIERKLGLPDHNDGPASDLKLIKSAKIKKIMFNNSWDYSELEKIHRGGVTENTLFTLVQETWAEAWQELLKQDPNYLKEFYKLVHQKHREGRIDLNQKEAIALSQKASTTFANWYQKNPSIHPMGSINQKPILKAIRWNKEYIIYFNFQTNPLSIVDDKSFMPGHLKPISRHQLFMIGQGKVFGPFRAKHFQIIRNNITQTISFRDISHIRTGLFLIPVE